MTGFSEESGEAVIRALLSCSNPATRLREAARELYAESGGSSGVLDRSCGEVAAMICGRLGELLAACIRENERLLDALAELRGGECVKLLRELHQALSARA